MNLAEWNLSPEHIAAFAQFITSDVGKDFMDVLREGDPSRFHPLPPIGSNESDKFMALGQIMGYQEIFARIEAMQLSAVTHKPIQSHYEEPEGESHA